MCDNGGAMGGRNVRRVRLGYLVVNTPERVVLGIVMFPEPFKSDISIIIRILSLPFINRHRGGRECRERVFWSFFFWNTIIFFLFILVFVLFLRCFLGFLGRSFLLGSGLFFVLFFLLGG